MAKKQGTTAVVAWEKEMADKARVAAAVNTPMSMGKSITTKGGILAVDGEPVEGNELRAIIIGDIYENTFYTKDYDANTPTVPDCYAFSDPDATDGKEAVAAMVPHEEAENRQGRPADQDQNTEYEATEADDGQVACRNCWANVMGTANVGRGKACKNIRRLIMITEDGLESAQALLDAETRTLKVPVMSTNNWALHVNKLADEYQRPPEAVVTLIKVVPDAKSQFKIQFEFVELITFDQELYDALKKKMRLVRPILISPYPKAADLASTQQQSRATPRPGRGAPSRPGTPAGRPGAKPGAARPSAAAPAGKKGKF